MGPRIAHTVIVRPAVRAEATVNTRLNRRQHLFGVERRQPADPIPAGTEEGNLHQFGAVIPLALYLQLVESEVPGVGVEPTRAVRPSGF